MKKLMSSITVILLVLGVAGAANAFSIDISAYDNSLKNDPLNTRIYVNAGDTLSIHVDSADMWSAGSRFPMSRKSNADGLGNPFGGDYGMYSHGGATFRFGSLVGRIGSGDYFFVGTDFDRTVETSGELTLLYWDVNYRDNRGAVTANISVNNPVPISPTLYLFGAGLCGLLGIRIRNKNKI